MNKNYIEIYKNISKHFKYQTIILIMILTCNAILDVLSISLLVPIIKIAQDQKLIHEIQNHSYQVYSYLKNYNNQELVILSSLLFLLFYLIKTFFSIFVLRFQIFYLAKLKFNLATLFFKIYSKKNYSFYKKYNSNKILVDLDKHVTQFCERFAFSFISLISEFLIICGYLIFLYLMGKGNFLVILLFLFIIVYIFNKVSKNKINKASQIWQNLNIKKIKILQEFIKGIKEIKTKRVDGYFVNTFKKSSKEYEKSFAKFNFLQLTPRYVFELLALSGIVLYFVFLLKKQNLNTILPDIILVFAVTIRLAPSFSRVIYYISNLKFSKISFFKVKDVLSNMSYSKIRKKNIRNITKIKFEDVNFSYNEKKIFNNLNFTIFSNEHVCLSGPSGSGKSTFIELMCGLIAADNGKIIINDSYSFDNNIHSIPAVYVPQDPIILDATIKENIIFGESIVDDERLKNALLVSGLQKWTAALDKGFDNVVGESGGNISGGQRQRLALARGIYSSMKKQIVILDEPLSAVDSKTKDVVFQNILKELKNKILIVITHDENNFKYFKKKYKLENKNIINI